MCVSTADMHQSRCTFHPYARNNDQHVFVMSLISMPHDHEHFIIHQVLQYLSFAQKKSNRLTLVFSLELCQWKILDFALSYSYKCLFVQNYSKIELILYSRKGTACIESASCSRASMYLIKTPFHYFDYRLVKGDIFRIARYANIQY